MRPLIEEFKQKSNFCCEKGASLEEINRAEVTIGMTFAAEYKDYLQQFGSASCGGHELTGISEDASLDVVQVTLANIERNPNIKMPLYVIEETHIDGIVIWQASSGEVFKAEYKGEPKKVYDSLMDYVLTFENKKE